jgi:hypothetical protein
VAAKEKKTGNSTKGKGNGGGKGKGKGGDKEDPKKKPAVDEQVEETEASDGDTPSAENGDGDGDGDDEFASAYIRGNPPEEGADGEPQREIIYPSFTFDECQGDAAITVEQAKIMLGWTENAKLAARWGANEPLFKDRFGKSIYLINNIINRPIYWSIVEKLVQDHLLNQWKFNGEPIIIGKTGLILNGQHSLIALILAEQDRVGGFKGSQEGHWSEYHSGPITMEKVVEYGIEETDEVINTMDTAKPRSLSDVIYRSVYFRDKPMSDRRAASKVLASSIDLLWKRTGAKRDVRYVGGGLVTHPELMQFIGKHPKLIEAVSHVLQEDKKGTISKLVRPLGIAAGLLYLMGCSDSDIDDYTHNRTEDVLTWTHWDAGCLFWTKLSEMKDPGFKEVQFGMNALIDPVTGKTGSTLEKICVLVKAWKLYIEDQNIDRKLLKLKYKTNESGVTSLGEPIPLVSINGGGIDIGDPRDLDEDDGGGDDPPPEQIADMKNTIRNENEEKDKEKEARRVAQREKILAMRKEGNGDTGKEPAEPGKKPIARKR